MSIVDGFALGMNERELLRESWMSGAITIAPQVRFLFDVTAGAGMRRVWYGGSSLKC